MGLSLPRRPVVLIVEDELLLRMDAADMVAGGGLRGGRSRRMPTRRSEFSKPAATSRVVFTDIQMPGSMDGLKLARAVSGRWPPIKIVATSGLVDVGEKDLPEGGRFLPKPYHAKQVAGFCSSPSE